MKGGLATSFDKQLAKSSHLEDFLCMLIGLLVRDLTLAILRQTPNRPYPSLHFPIEMLPFPEKVSLMRGHNLQK